MCRAAQDVFAGLLGRFRIEGWGSVRAALVRLAHQFEADDARHEARDEQDLCP